MKKSLGARPPALPTPVWVVGSYDADGRPNMMTAAWAGICCGQPPCVTVSLRKATYSYGNLMARKAYTVNLPSVEMAEAADFFGMASGRDMDKPAAAGLTVVKSDLVDAPYLKEFPLVVECRVIHTLEIGLHTQFVGEIMDVKADESVLNASGQPDIQKMKPFVFIPEQRDYYQVREVLGSAFEMGRELFDKAKKKNG